jgi:hypothetical protein
MSSQLNTPAALTAGKSPSVPTGKKAVWVPELVSMILRRENFFISPGLKL